MGIVATAVAPVEASATSCAARAARNANAANAAAAAAAASAAAAAAAAAAVAWAREVRDDIAEDPNRHPTLASRSAEATAAAGSHDPKGYDRERYSH